MNRYEGFRDLLTAKAGQHPDRPAFFYEKGGIRMSMTYAQFYEQCRSLSETWIADGKTALGILCDGSMDCVTAVFASVLSGMQTVLLDENASSQLLMQQIRETDIDCLWGDEELLQELEEALTDGCRQEHAGKLLFFTSGTTSRCKAVVLTDRSLMSSAWNGSSMLSLSPEDILMCMLPLNHVFGFVCSLLWGLQCSAAIALGRGARHYIDDLTYFTPTVLSAVPSLLAFLLRQNVLCPQLRLILVGAGDCPPAILAQAASHGLQVRFGYGLTETSSGVAISTGGDPYALSVCPDDTVSIASDGEILVEAPTCMMEGYYKKAEDTAAVLQDGILHTGDLGRLDQAGRLHVTGRKKEILVLTDGSKIYLPEYEERLRNILDGRDLAVISIRQRPVLVIREDPEHRQEILDALAPLMADYPRGQQLQDILFTDQPLPRTATGKLMRWKIQKEIRL